MLRKQTRAPRAPFELEVRAFTNDTVIGRGVNLSASGMLLEVPPWATPTPFLRLQLKITRHRASILVDEHVSVDALLVRQGGSSGSWAVQFVNAPNNLVEWANSYVLDHRRRSKEIVLRKKRAKVQASPKAQQGQTTGPDLGPDVDNDDLRRLYRDALEDLVDTVKKTKRP